MSKPILYSFRRCPYAMRARLALMASEEKVELREIVLRNKPEAFLEASPSATVPCLVRSAGAVIDESLDIMLWALEQSDPLDWLPEGSHEGAAVFALIGRCDGPFKENLDGYKYAPLKKDKLLSDEAINHRMAAMEFITDLNEILARSAGLSGDTLTLADAAIAPFIRQFANVDSEWFATQLVPHVHDWLHAFTTSEMFAHIMHKFEPWQEGEAGVQFP